MRKAGTHAGVAFLFLFFMLALIFPFAALPTEARAAEKGGNFTNLVVFLKFDGESEFVDDICGGKASVKQITENSYSLADYSVKDYYARVSDGAVDMETVYLFASDGGSLTLSKSRGYYCTQDDIFNPNGYTSGEYELRMVELRRDWAGAINAAVAEGCRITDLSGTKVYEIDDLDRNGDGCIDSLTVIYKYSTQFSVSWKDCLWNYQSYCNMVELQGKNGRIVSNAYVQMTANYDFVYLNEGGEIPFANLKVMIHETGHIFGLKDLYQSQSNSPVYYMSAMSNAISPVPQYISAKEREALGWLKADHISTIDKGGEYSIGVTSDRGVEGTVCYKCEIPGGKMLYLEYRKFDGTANKYDTQERVIYDKNGEKLRTLKIESGLVCFLVDKDTLFPNNLYSSSRNWNYQVLGGQYATKSDAPLGVGENLWITANLQVEVLRIEGDKLTFSLTGTDIVGGHAHRLTEVPFRDSTCSDYGNVGYNKCEDCGKFFSLTGTEIKQSDTVIALKEHEPKKIAGKDATCQQTGLSDGYECKNCHKTLVSQIVTDKLPHEKSDWIIDKLPLAGENGSKHIECLHCGSVLERETLVYEEKDPPVTPPNNGKDDTPGTPVTPPDNGKDDVPDTPVIPPDNGKDDTPDTPVTPPDGGKDDTLDTPVTPPDSGENNGEENTVTAGCNASLTGGGSAGVLATVCLLGAFSVVGFALFRRKKTRINRIKKQAAIKLPADETFRLYVGEQA